MIFVFSHIWVTSLTFLSHVTSSPWLMSTYCSTFRTLYLLTYLLIYLLTESPVWKIRLITASLHHHIHISTFITSHILSVYQHDNSWIRYRYHLTTMFKTWFLSKSPYISNGFQDICIFLYLGHDLDLFWVTSCPPSFRHFEHFSRFFTYLLTYLPYHLFSCLENTPSLLTYSPFYPIFYHYRP